MGSMTDYWTDFSETLLDFLNSNYQLFVIVVGTVLVIFIISGILKGSKMFFKKK